MIVLGFSQMIYIPILIPEICEIMKKNDQSSKGKKEMACCLFSFALALTQIFGSIIGGVLGDKFGFERGMAIYAVVLFGYLGFFAVFSKQKENYKEKINENEKKSEIESLLILEKSEAN
jgi:MFS family permease